MLLSTYFQAKWYAKFITYFGIKWSFSAKMNSKGPLSRGSRFKFHFYLGWQGNRGSSQSFHAASFSRDCRSIIPKTRHLTRIKCMAIPIRFKTIWQIQKSKYTYGTKSLVYFYPYKSKIENDPYREAVILKFTLIWNFGKIKDWAKISTEFHFLGYRILIKPSHIIIPNS